MYTSSKLNKKEILKVDENFVRLLEINNVNLGTQQQATFEFSFKISQLEAIKENAYSVLITIKKPSQNSEPLIVPTTMSGFSSADSRKLISNILGHKTKLLKLNDALSNDIIATKHADITAKINNHVLKAINVGKSLQNLGFEKTKIMVTQQNDLTATTKIENQEVFKTKDEINDRLVRIELIKYHSISPSAVASLGDNTITAYAGLTGVLRKDYRNRYKYPLTQLANSYAIKTKVKQTEYKTVIGQTFDEVIEINTPIVIDDFLRLRSTSVVVSFELLKTLNNLNGDKEILVLDKVEKTLNLSSYLGKLSLANMPKVGLSFNDKYVYIHTKYKKDKTELSSAETNVTIYKKIIDEDFISRYEIISNNIIQNNSFDEIQRYQDYHIHGQTSIYRVCVDGSSEFSDIVFKSPKSKLFTKLVIVPFLTKNSVTISVTNNGLSDVIAARLLYRDVTIKEKNFSISNSLVTFNGNSNGSFFLENLRSHHVYEFTTKLLFKSGIELISNYSSFLEYVPCTSDISFSVSDISTLSADVNFVINATIPQDQVGLLSSMLSQTVATYDLSSFSKRAAPLDKFIAFNVMRYNISNGDVDNLGLVANNTRFVDSELSLRSSSPQLTQGHSYKYIVYPLVRDPSEIMVESVDVTDPETRKAYKLNPRKHRHPLTLIKGSIVSKDFLDRDPKNDMLYGSLGISTQVNVEIPKVSTTIQSFFASYLDKNKIILSWSTKSNITNTSNIDHFIIFKEIDGIKSIIGKSHSFNDDLSYVYETSKHDIGNVRFSLLPIYMDYSSGTTFSSNYLLIS